MEQNGNGGIRINREMWDFRIKQVQGFLFDLKEAAKSAGLFVVIGQSVIDGVGYDVVYLQKYAEVNHNPSHYDYQDNVVSAGYIKIERDGFVNALEAGRVLRNLRETCEKLTATDKRETALEVLTLNG